jgi:hypothetical protein
MHHGVKNWPNNSNNIGTHLCTKWGKKWATKLKYHSETSLPHGVKNGPKNLNYHGENIPALKWAKRNSNTIVNHCCTMGLKMGQKTHNKHREPILAPWD